MMQLTLAMRVLAGLLMLAAYWYFNAALLAPVVVLVGVFVVPVMLVRAVGRGGGKHLLRPLIVAGGLVSAYYGLHWGASSRFDRLEARFAPFIAAAEAYREQKGRYPERAEELVPGHLASLPSCDPDGRPPGVADLNGSGPNYYVRPDGSFRITCYTIAFSKLSYDSDEKRWYSWD